MTARRPRVLAVGFDGGDPEWIAHWLAQGRLPALARIARDGVFARAKAPFSSLLDAQWVSLSTGTDPGAHGHYFHRQPRAGDLAFHATRNGSHLHPFWAALPPAGRRAVVIDVPKTRLVDSDAIVQVIGWGEKFPMLRTSRPAGLLREIEVGVGAHPIGSVAPDIGGDRAARRLLERILRGVDLRMEFTTRLMRETPWDLFLTVFSESHIAGYDFFPRGLAIGAPSPGPDADGWRPIRHVYERIDQALGQLWAEAGPETDIVVFSPHGLRERFDSFGVLAPVLRALGYLVPPPPRAPDLVQRVRDFLPYGVRERINRLLSTEKQSALVSRFLAASCDWPRTRAYCEDVTRENQPWIRLNLRGREPFGTVDPGREYDGLCAEISEELGLLRTHPGGVEAVRAVVKARDAYSSAHADQLPDLIVEWNDRAEMSAVTHPRLGVIPGDVPTLRATTHSGWAFIAACGPSIEAGARLHEPCTLDLAPTILHLLEVAAPKECSGRLLTEALRGEARARPAQVAPDLDLRANFWDPPPGVQGR
jgi:predicted AlkP superfamily phosphohydrolase/phosphomutase